MSSDDFPKSGPADQVVRTVIEKARARREYRQSEGEEFTGWSTGFEGLDEITGGFPRSGLYLLSGGPGVGKTTLALHLAANVARKIPVIYLTFENNPISLVEKLVCAGGAAPNLENRGVDIGNLQRGNKKEKVIDRLEDQADGYDWLQNLKIIGAEAPAGPKRGVDGSRWDVEKLHKLVEETVEETRSRPADERPPGLENLRIRPRCMVVVDYLQHWGKRNPNLTDLSSVREKVEQMGSRLMRLAEKENAAVLAVASQNRSRGYGQRGGSSDGKFRSSLSSLKESGDLEYMADVVMFLVPRRDLVGGDDVDELILEVVKNRHGEPGDLPLNFKGRTAQFWNANST